MINLENGETVMIIILDVKNVKAMNIKHGNAH